MLCLSVCLCNRVWVHVWVCVCLCMWVYGSVCVCASACVWERHMSMCVCECVCVVVVGCVWCVCAPCHTHAMRHQKCISPRPPHEGGRGSPSPLQAGKGKGFHCPKSYPPPPNAPCFYSPSLTLRRPQGSVTSVKKD